MRKLFLSAVLLASLTAAAAQQPAEGERGHMRMNGMMMQKCPMAGMTGSVDVSYEATDTGARLVFTPKDPKQMTEVQAMVREMAERMGKHDIHHPEK